MEYTPAELPRESVVKPMLTRGRKFMILGAILFIAFGYFAYTALVSATSFYMTVDQYMAQGPVVGQHVQVEGYLKAGSFVHENSDSVAADFVLTQNGVDLPAHYQGVPPDLFFSPEAKIVLAGTYTSGGVFDATQVLVKCPSKYQALQANNSSSAPSA